MALRFKLQLVVKVNLITILTPLFPYSCTLVLHLITYVQHCNVIFYIIILKIGSSYDIFNRYVSEKTGLAETAEDIEDITDDEISLIRRLDSPFITEAHRVIKENKGVVATSVLAIVVGVLVIISLVVWIIVKIW